MSYDEQPDGDIHGECALEIKTLGERIATQAQELQWLRAHVKKAATDAHRHVYEAWKSGQVSAFDLDKKGCALCAWHLAALQPKEPT